MRRFYATKALLSKFQYVSDLHIDVNPKLRIKPKAENLLIAGDLGNDWTQKSEQFIKDLTSDFERVIMVPGNHEYYNPLGMRDSFYKMYETHCKLDRFLLLDNTVLSLRNDNVTVVGTTLWSHIPRSYWEIYGKRYNDFKHICTRLTPNNPVIPLDPLEYNLLYESSKYFLDTVLPYSSTVISKSDLVIFLSHHSPLLDGTCHPKYLEERVKSLNHGYCTDLSQTLDKISNAMPNVDKVWIHGHTHYRRKPFYYNKFGWVVSNPYGFLKCMNNRKSYVVPTATLDQNV